MKLRKNLPLIGLSILLLAGTAFFKFKTGSFLHISNASDREVQRYTINFRRQDLSIPSLTASCRNIDQLYDSVVANTDLTSLPCLSDIAASIHQRPKDSVMLLIFQKLMLHAVFSEDSVINGQLIKFVQNDSFATCGHAAKMVFEQNSQKDWIIVGLEDFDHYIGCICPMDNMSEP